jgi:hypothetical protein
MKSLFDNAISTGQPVATSWSQCRSRARPWKVFLPKSWVGSTRMPLPGHTAREQALRLAGDLGDHVGHHVGVAHPMRAPAGHRAPGVRADDADAELRGHLAERGIGARPRVVEQVGALEGGGAADRGPPRVDADHDLGVAGAHRGDERHYAADLLGEVDVDAGPAFTPADVDDVAPSATAASTRSIAAASANVAPRS